MLYYCCLFIRSFLQLKFALIQPYVADWAQSTKYLANCNQ